MKNNTSNIRNKNTTNKKLIIKAVAHPNKKLLTRELLNNKEVKKVMCYNEKLDEIEEFYNIVNKLNNTNKNKRKKRVKDIDKS